MGYVVIYDLVSWTTGSTRDGDFAVHTLPRGETLPDSIPQDKIDEWLDVDRYSPHGAIAEEGSQLAKLGASGVSVALDPAEARRRFLDAAGAERQLHDPAREASDRERTDVDPGVARSREAAATGIGTGTSEIASGGPGTTQALQVDDMNKTQLRAMADGLGVEHTKGDSVEELREKIRAHMGTGQDQGEQSE